MTEAQELTVTETTQATPTPAFHQEQVKKPRTPAQMAALEAARQKAFAIRAEKKKEKILPVDQRVAAPEPVAEEPHEEVEYVKKGKAKPKAKKRIVVVEESSSEDEIEIRLPKRKNVPNNERDAPTAGQDDRQLKLESSMKKMFSL